MSDDDRPDSQSDSGRKTHARPVSRRQRESTVKRKVLSFVVFVILALSTLNALFGERGVLGLIEARKAHRGLVLEVERLRADNRALSREIHELRTNPLAVEKRAREVLGMARPDEIALRVEETDSR